MPMQTIELAKYPDIARVIRAADPSYRKKNAFVSVREKVSLDGTFWDGGSRSTYTAVNLATFASAGAPHYSPPQFGGPRVTPEVPVPEGFVIVETGIFCGKTATAHVSVNPANVTKLLPAP